MAFLGRKPKTTEVSTKKAGLRSTKSVPLLPPHLRRSAAAGSEKRNKPMNNVTLSSDPEPYLDPIVTKRSQRPLSQVTSPGPSPKTGPNPRRPILPPNLLSARKSPKLARSQSEIRPGNSYDRATPERRRSERKKKPELAYLIVDLRARSNPSPSGSKKKTFAIRETSAEEALRQRTMSVPTRPTPLPRPRTGCNSTSSSPHLSDTSTSSSCSSHQEELAISRSTSPRPIPMPRSSVLLDSSPVRPPRRSKSSKRPSPSDHPSTGSRKPKPVRPPPPSSFALQRVKEKKTRTLSANRSPPTVAMSLPPRLLSHRSATLCTEHSANRPDYEEIDQLDATETPLQPHGFPPPKLSQDNALPLLPKRNSRAKPRTSSTISVTPSRSLVPNHSPSSRSSSVPNVQPLLVEEPSVDELDVGGGIYEPVNTIEPLPHSMAPPLPVRNTHTRKSTLSSGINKKLGRSLSASPVKGPVSPVMPRSDPLRRRRPPPPPPETTSLATSTGDVRTRANSNPDTTTSTESSQQIGELKPHDGSSDAKLSKALPIYEEIGLELEEGDEMPDITCGDQSVGGPNILPLPPKPAAVSRVQRLHGHHIVPEMSEPIQLPVGEYVLAKYREDSYQETTIEEEPDIGGIEEYVEMNPQNGWEREPPQSEGTAATELEDQPGETYVQMHPVTSVSPDHASSLAVSGEEGTQEEEEDEGGEEIYIEMNADEYIPPPSIYYASTDLVGPRRDLQADFVTNRTSAEAK